jgi:hypothetical protein
MRLDKALEQISEIHKHLATSQVFRGYRAVPSELSGILALAAAWIQPAVVPGGDPRLYVLYWTLVAVAAFLISGGSVIYGYLQEADPLSRQRTAVVVGQLAPSLAVGVVITVVFVVAEEGRLISFLPGIWALLYGLGLFASRLFLPKMIGWVALFYFLCGCVLLRGAVGLGPTSLSPWEVGIPFGAGHILGGLILYWNLERKHHDS